MRSHPTPGDTAIGDVPARYARVLAIETEGDLAVIYLELNEPPVVHHDIVIALLGAEGWQPWHESGAEGGGESIIWTRHPRADETSDNPLGIGVYVGETHPGSSRVTVRVGDREKRLDVFDGWFLYVDFEARAESWDSEDLVVVATEH